MKKRYAALIFCAIGLLLGSVTSEAKKKPSVTAESAIVMDVQSGAILYEKNIDKREYPASITKVMTALVAIENSSLSETVTYSKNAVTNLESGASNIEIHLFDEEEKYMIIMQDNGCGCKEIHYGYGLKQMNERVSILNGSIHFYSEEGFRTVVEIPKIGGKKDD